MEQVAAVAVVDAQGRVTGWSTAARLLTGHSAEEVVGRPVTDLLDGNLPRGILGARSGTVSLRHRDGHRIELNLSARPILGADGRHTGFVVTAEPPGPALAARAFQQASMAMSVFDLQQRYLRVNDVASHLMGVSEEALHGRFYPDTVEDAEHSRGFLAHLRQVAETGLPVRYESFTSAPALNREHAWSIEMWPLCDDSGEPTAVALAALDSSEQHWARRRLALLNEAATGIGTTLDVVRTAEELIGLLVPQYADFASVDLLDWVLGADEPPRTQDDGVVLRRVAHGSTRPGNPGAAVRLGEADFYPPSVPPARALREGRAVLSQADEPDFAQWLAERNARSPQGRPFRKGVHSLIAVPLRARGITLGVAVCVRMAHPDDYASDDAVFAEELASRAAVCIDNARRFARERATALALQHSLLPQGLPGQAALDVAHRYLPCGSLAGIGGDWFDVIPLSGSRVGLVVGDVVGHGIQSSATMGRLRTAVRTLADVDLPPDELLTHLDDLVTHLASEDSSEEVAELGATCLYAVYDPVSRRLTLAAAGHPAPVVVLPGSTAEFVPLIAGPPLGVGGLPFEATELDLPEGSVVALYTDGLIEDRDRDPDGASEELRRALGTPADTLDALCDNILKAVLPDQPGDDVALLLACTRALGTDRVATWDVSPDPAQVAVLRQAAGERLAAWGLEETAFVTELVVSELVTNAIRYGVPPIQLRLIRDRALICEVSDASSTSPHLRRAHAYDEGGRGLLLVAQLTQRWGSRQTGIGKTIWAEQPLPGA
ncbi:PAS sensor protein [Streptomyces pluripotens]|uniref:PAS sensor protein n=1 Tax=Streptomyces pluripotens TaxID=1355015 RepID=A0A221P6G6_9ACTN|nr:MULTISPECIES: SpoIIE family protein phosphatase [Streptomyces]ARP73645.1 PAS sensor protein [Streptomyces pluripotens]ASN27893.1 PAS sensor protein [Streptomyces pluripotens]KIE24944.1 PAS/PAC sensor protein [Streptomyces sp. MUSC 125]MCH0561369.1 SpoIIE family protein phosphatase [Streptomyces sp. MUM 16J]